MKSDTICGLKQVDALFARRASAVQRLFHLPEMRPAAGPFCALLAKARKPYRMVDAEELEKIAGTPHHGGIVAVRHRPRAPPSSTRPTRRARNCCWCWTASATRITLAPSPARRRSSREGLADRRRPRPRIAIRCRLPHLRRRARMARPVSQPQPAGGPGAIEPYYRTVAASLGRDSVALPDLPRDRPIALVLGQ